jgi:hypothetical protein
LQVARTRIVAVDLHSVRVDFHGGAAVLVIPQLGGISSTADLARGGDGYPIKYSTKGYNFLTSNSG